MNNSLLLILVTVFAACHATELEDWQDAIYSGDKETMKSMLQKPRDLLKTAREKGLKVWGLLEPHKERFAEHVLLGKEVNIDAGVHDLEDFYNAVKEIDAMKELNETLIWSNDRSNDTISPLSGDTRSLFELIRMQVEKQMQDLLEIVETSNLVLCLHWFKPATPTEAKDCAWQLYAIVHNRRGYESLNDVDRNIDHFFDSFDKDHPDLADNNDETDYWTEALASKNKTRVAELLEEPKTLMDLTIIKGQALGKVLKNMETLVAGYLLVNETIDVQAAYDLIEDASKEMAAQDFSSEVSKLQQWFTIRANDSVTPVDGDVRAFLTRAQFFLSEHEIWYNDAKSGLETKFWLKKLIGHDDDPKSVQKARVLAIDLISKILPERATSELLIMSRDSLTGFYNEWVKRV